MVMIEFELKEAKEHSFKEDLWKFWM